MSEERIREVIAKLKWKHSVNRWYPHSYILQKWHPEEFAFLAQAIAQSPYYDFWKNVRYANLYLDGMKYWVMQDVINRKPAEPPAEGYCGGETNIKTRNQQGA
jgi:hypothetical protein